MTRPLYNIRKELMLERYGCSIRKYNLLTNNTIHAIYSLQRVRLRFYKFPSPQWVTDILTKYSVVYNVLKNTKGLSCRERRKPNKKHIARDYDLLHNSDFEIKSYVQLVGIAPHYKL